MADEPPAKPQPKPNERPTVAPTERILRPTNETPTKVQPKATKGQTVEEPIQIRSAIGKSFFAHPYFALAALIGCLIVQVRHFAICYALVSGDIESVQNLTFGALLGIFAESFGIVQAVNNGKRSWIFVVSAISFTVNCLSAQVWLKDGYLYGGSMLMNAIVPGCILGFSLLYLEKNKAR